VYTGTDPNLTDLQNQISTLLLRTTAVDGQGMKDPSQSQLGTIIKAVNALQSDLNQLTLQLESLLKQLQQTVNTNTTTVKQVFNLT
jgi:hypothetical protein